ncbi:ABC transporter permease [Actimicrobium sp. CCC2.4]|uniref:ABC transporter permease n=1 Tax=Actimicrobium sp. CCC2.4 TaxID=3048606 RepID=UPI002AC8F5D8|nr:ABC transporter permease [Actimicrobium sp. CCC2.4]MEB0134661.1 ABC transporter permease [Actimicrobium sp. CCC2.4]WPX30604.1 ABC transporter permease [Actimicrobium sp. CCC2.4]
MRYLVMIAFRSAWNRRLTLGLTVLAIALSVALLAGVERMRHSVRSTFAQSVSGTDLLIGARGSPLQLMLHAVFRIGEPTGNIRWHSFRQLADRPEVAWAIPLSLGDAHHGFPVIGTTAAYFDHFRYGRGSPLVLASGRRPDHLFEVVPGADVADQLGYRPGDQITLSHGLDDSDLAEHADKPFTVVGILARTGTPVDRSVHVSLESIEAIHLDWHGGAHLPGLAIPAGQVRKFDLAPKHLSAALIGLHNRADVFRLQQAVREFRDEPLQAVLPGVALGQLWQLTGVVETVLLAISALVLVTASCSMVAVILAGLNERRRELAILRSVGARPRELFLMLLIESTGLTVVGTLAGLALLALVSVIGAPLVQQQFGLTLQQALPVPGEWRLLMAVVGVGMLAGLVPGLRAYRHALAEGLTPRT